MRDWHLASGRRLVTRAARTMAPIPAATDAMRVVVYATMSMAAHLLPRLLGAMVGLRRQAQLTPPRTSFSRLVKRYFDAFDHVLLESERSASFCA